MQLFGAVFLLRSHAPPQAQAIYTAANRSSLTGNPGGADSDGAIGATGPRLCRHSDGRPGQCNRFGRRSGRRQHLVADLPVSLRGALLAITPMVAQLYGADKTAETGPLTRHGIVVALPLVLIAILLLGNAGFIFAWMELDPQVVAVSIDYLKVVS
jgi:MatE